MEIVVRMSQDLYPMLLGNVLEWYEFGVYGYLADEITENFFEEEWYTWLFFGISFILRPVCYFNLC